MIGAGGFVVHAIHIHLLWEFGDQARPADLHPPCSVADVVEEQARENQPREICSIVISIDIRLLNMSERKVAMEIERRQKTTAERLVTPSGAVRKNMEKPGPCENSQRGFHRAGPIHGVGEWVAADPLVYDVTRGCGIALVPGQEICLAGRDQPLQSGNPPGNFHIAWPIG